MNLGEFRRSMEHFREDADKEAAALKESYIALERLRALYRKLDFDERVMADQVLAEWTLSDDENLRFDAQALIDDFKVDKALPALRELAEQLLSSKAPGAPYELRKVNRIIQHVQARSCALNRPATTPDVIVSGVVLVWYRRRAS